MKRFLVSDTMAIVLRLERRKLPQAVRAAFEAAEKGECAIYLPAMSLAEIGYLSERKRIDATLQDVNAYCATYPDIEILPLTQEIITQSFEIDDVPELHDRLIAGSAYVKNLSLMTNDPVITRSRYVSAVW